MGTRLTIRAASDFQLAHAVCSYGYFILRPNRWVVGPTPDRGRLLRPLRDNANRVIRTTITQPGGRGAPLIITCHRKVARAQHGRLKRQVTRMLHLDEDYSRWYRLHKKAARGGFGRMYRSPSLFEDMVKTITACNVAWPNTIRMNELLCASFDTHGDFPTASELAKVRPERLKKLCRVGYRAERIVRLARDVTAGRLDLDHLEDATRADEEVYHDLVAIYGIGDFAAHNIMQSMGRYRHVPVDSETLRHFKQFHNVHGDLNHIRDQARAYYRRYDPYQFLAYWYELWGDYQSRYGRAQDWTEDVHDQFTASKLT
ncbi:MAG: DNA-3-methyladenine glycosylase family protein [Planctomycetota bacterium]|jgi:3-methyladenine DNA glycosylase/8-oxoguanine DNA glycosylase